MTKPPANASRANRPDGRSPTAREGPMPRAAVVACGAATSVAGESRVNNRANTAPNAAYSSTTTRWLASGVAAVRCSACDSTPPHSEPAAVASEPASVYQANTAGLAAGGPTGGRAGRPVGQNSPALLPPGTVSPEGPPLTRGRETAGPGT